MDTMIPNQVWKKARTCGNLNLSGRDLKDVPGEVFKLSENLLPGEKFWECVDLRRIDLSRNELVKIPDEFTKVDTLIELVLSFNSIRELPVSIGSIENLKKLDISNNSIIELPNSLSNLVNLSVLDMSHNKLKALPKETYSLGYNLDIFKCAHNQLTELPSIICHDHHVEALRLQEIILDHNFIKSLPETFGNLLPQLHTLELSSNSIQSLPESFCSLKSLKSLDLRHNKLSCHQLYLPSASQLDRLFLGYNQLTKLHDTNFKEIPNLSHLDLSNNQICVIPDNVGFLSSLKVLDVSNNNISILGYMKSLRKLILLGNPLRSIRSALVTGETSALKKYLVTRGPNPLALNALIKNSDNKIAMLMRNANYSGLLKIESTHEVVDDSSLFFDNIKSMFQQMHQLSSASKIHTLILSNCNLSSIPEAIHSFHQMKLLNFNNNKLETLPSGIGKLLKLSELHLCNNKLSSKAVDEVVFGSEIPPIKTINLSNNQLTAIPRCVWLLCDTLGDLNLSHNSIINNPSDDKHWSKLHALYLLDLSNNYLAHIPPTLYNHAYSISNSAVKLSTLNLENNSINVIPYELGLCASLKQLKLCGNPQRGIRQTVLQKPTEYLLNYLKDKLPLDQHSSKLISRPLTSNQSLKRGGANDKFHHSNKFFDDDVGITDGNFSKVLHNLVEESPIEKHGFVHDNICAADNGISTNGQSTSNGKCAAPTSTLKENEVEANVNASIDTNKIISAKAISLIDTEIRELEEMLEEPSLTRTKIRELQKLLRRSRADRARIFKS